MFKRFLVLGVGLVVVGCGSASPAQTVPPTTSPTTTSPPTTSPTTISPTTTSPVTTTPVTTSATGLDIPDELTGFELANVGIDDRLLTVAVADTPEERAQGLMHVTDLRDLDGMLFRYRESVLESYWMKDTVIPLDIAFFRSDGSLVHVVLNMVPCDTESCPGYGPDEQFRYAVEVPAGDFASLTGSEVLDLNP